jgi:hypothetical protein
MHQRVKILVRAFEMISDEKCWAQGASAIDRSGAPVRTTDRRAVAWCAVGALDRAAGNDDELFESCLQYLQKASLQLFRGDPAVINDNTDHVALVEMYARAIQLANRHGNHNSSSRVSSYRRPARDDIFARTRLRLVSTGAAAAAGGAR